MWCTDKQTTRVVMAYNIVVQKALNVFHSSSVGERRAKGREKMRRLSYKPASHTIAAAGSGDTPKHDHHKGERGENAVRQFLSQSEREVWH